MPFQNRTNIKKKVCFLLLALILFSSCVFAGSAIDKATITTAKIGTQKYQPSDKNGVIGTVTIDNNIVQNSFTDCDILTCTTKISITTTKDTEITASDIVGKYSGKKGKGDVSVNGVYYYVETNQILTRPTYATVTVPESQDENGTTVPAHQTQIQNGTEQYTVTTQVKTQLTSLTLKAGIKYTFYIEYAKSNPNIAVDLYPQIFGSDTPYKELAWWNANWNSYREVNVTCANCLTNLTSYYFNLTTPNSVGQEVRFTTLATGTETECGGYWNWNETATTNEFRLNCTLQNGTGITSIREYYNNVSTTTDNRNATLGCKQGDIFDGTAVKPIWSCALGTCTVGSGNITLNGADGWLTSTRNFSTQKSVFEMRLASETLLTANAIDNGLAAGEGSVATFHGSVGGANNLYVDNVAKVQIWAYYKTFREYRFVKNTTHVSFYNYSSLIASYATTTSANKRLNLYEWTSKPEAFDWICLYDDMETTGGLGATFSAWSSEISNTIPPVVGSAVVTAIAPLTNYQVNNSLTYSAFSFSYNGNDTSMNCTLNMSGTNANWTIANNYTTTTLGATVTSDGAYSWNITCTNGTLSNTSTTQTITFAKPSVVLSVPANSYQVNNSLNYSPFTYTYTTNASLSSMSCSLIGNGATLNTTSTLNNTATSLSVNVTNPARYLWNVTCTNGSVSSTSASKNITFASYTSRISPTPTTYPGVTLMGYCNASDADSNYVSYAWNWYRNNTLYSSYTSNSSLCYQETATTATACGGLATGNYASSGGLTSKIYDGDWSTYNTRGSSDYFSFYYTIPNNASKNSIIWQVKDGTGTANLSIPSDCIAAVTNSNLSLYTWGGYNAGTQSTWYCSNATANVYLRNTSNFNIYEEAIWWNMTPSYPSSIEQNIANISSSSVIASDNWTFDCTSSSTVGVVLGPINSTSTTIETGLNLTLNSPTTGTLTMNKTELFNYTVNLTTPVRVQLYLDNAVIETDDIATDTTITHYDTATFGNHTWYVYAYNVSNTAISANTTPLSFEVQFNVSNLAPVNASTQVSIYLNFTYNINTSYDVLCSLWLNGINAGNQTVNATGTGGITAATIIGNNTWYLSCVGDNPAYVKNTTSWNFTNSYNVPANSYIINSTILGAVYLTPQTLYYDIAGDINTLFFLVNGSTDTLYLFNISNNAIANTWTGQLNTTKNFFIVFRENGYNSVFTPDKDNATLHFINYNATLNIVNVSRTTDITSNIYHNPYTYADTEAYPTINYSANSTFVFMLPYTNGSTQLIGKAAGSTAFTVLATKTNNSHALAWQTTASDVYLSKWYYAWPDNATTTSDKIAVYSYTAGTLAKVAIPDTTTYNSSQINNSIIRFQTYQSQIFYEAFNITNGNATIYRINDGVYWSLNQSITNPSKLYFIDNNTFVFFSSESGTTYAYSCWFGGTTGACDRISSTSYGYVVPYVAGYLTTAMENSLGSTTIGQTLSSSVIQFAYYTYLYDARFDCYDEITTMESRKPFTAQIINETPISTSLTTQIYGYIVPSSFLGTGTKQIYAQCLNGTNRLYLETNNGNYLLNFFSLNTTLGSYYTFTVQNLFGAIVPGAVVSATKFSVALQGTETVEQAITDSTGKATLFMQPGTAYSIVVTNGATNQSFTFSPGTTVINTITLDSNSNIPVLNTESFWNDVVVVMQPNNQQGFWSNISFNINFSVSSANSSLSYYGLQVTQIANGTSAVVYFQNISGSSSGGVLDYTPTDYGVYQAYYWFYDNPFGLYYSYTFTYYFYPDSTTQTAAQIIGSGGLLSPFAFYIVAMLCATIAGGYMARYSLEGGGLAALVILWGFTLLYPNGIVVNLLGGAVGMSCLAMTSLVTIAAGAAFFVRTYL